FMYPSTKALKRPEVKAFLQYVNDNYQAIADASQIVAMDSDQAAKAKAALGEELEAETTSLGRGGRPEAPSLRAARRRWGETAIKGLLGLAAAISLVTTIGIVYALVEENLIFLREVP